MSNVLTFEEACGRLGLEVSTLVPDFGNFPIEDREGMIALSQLVIMTKAMNHGKEGKPIYYPVFWRQHPSGGGFRFFAAGSCFTVSFVGSRLCFTSRADAEFAGENWTALYEKWHMYTDIASIEVNE